MLNYLHLLPVAKDDFVTWHDESKTFFVRIDRSVLHTIEQYRQHGNNMPEAGGVLIGEVYGVQGIWVKAITVPASGDLASRISFVRRDVSHIRALESWYKKSGGKMQYLGEWHTHPQDRPSPSNIDYDSWKTLQISMKMEMIDQSMLFLIASLGQQDNDWIALFNGIYLMLTKK